MGPEETVDDTKKKQPSHLKNLSYYFSEYCDNTSIHGLKFVGERKRSIIEKIWWLIFIVASLYFCATLIWNTYQKWLHAPVLVSLASYETPIWDVPFPAVTLCPLIKAEKSKFDLSDVLSRIEDNFELSNEETMQFKYISLVCPKLLHITANMSDTNTTDEGAIKFLINSSPSLDNIISVYKWSGKKCNQDIDFTPILTSGGVCYTFNILDRDELFTTEAAMDYYKDLSINHQPASQWTIEKGFENTEQLTTFPRRTLLPGTNGGLELTLFTSGEDTDYNCNDASEGYKVILHHPAEIPRFHQGYFWVPLDQIVSVDINPNMMTTSPELKTYTAYDRKCYYNEEKTLRFFKVYNQQNCLLECLANFTYRHCSCVGFYMPRDKSTPICGPAKMECLKEANIEFIAREAKFQIKNVGKTRKQARKKKIECRCFPSCFAIEYNPQTSQLNWNWRQGKNLNTSYDNKTIHFSKLRIFFKDMQFLTLQRNELYGQTEFWANCGGLLGLFTGFSFISLVEIIYFATLRFVCNVKKYGWRYWSGSKELLESKPLTSFL